MPARWKAGYDAADAKSVDRLRDGVRGGGALPLVALAQDQPKTIAPYDGRLEGYGKQVTLDTGSTALTWMLLIFLGLICLGVLFKNARRSHLD